MASIVVIENDKLMRELLNEWLVDAGYDVRHARASDLPIELHADLVIVDLYMPRQRGLEIVRLVQRASRGKPIIAISAQFHPGLDASVRAAHALGVQRLIAKPFTREELLAAICSVIG
jgi:DNA-binding response OmpR family regulator